MMPQFPKDCIVLPLYYQYIYRLPTSLVNFAVRDGVGSSPKFPSFRRHNFKHKKYSKCPQNFKNLNSNMFELFCVFVTTLIYLYNSLVFQDNPTISSKGREKIEYLLSRLLMCLSQKTMAEVEQVNTEYNAGGARPACIYERLQS